MFRGLRSLIVAGLGVVALLAAVVPAGAYENTIRVRVSPERQGQCGDAFFATGGHEHYRHAKVLLDGRLIGEYDLANQGDCAKVLEEVVDLPDGGKAVVTVEVGGARMSADANARDRNRIFTMGFFVDHNNGELTQDHAPPRARTAAPETAAAPPPGTWRNTVDLMVAKARLDQCGDRFFATGGSEIYRFARLSVGGQEVARYDFAKPEDCTRVTTLVYDLPDRGKVVVELKVGPYTMSADVNARERARRYAVHFFIGEIWGEVTKDQD